MKMTSGLWYLHIPCLFHYCTNTHQHTLVEVSELSPKYFKFIDTAIFVFLSLACKKLTSLNEVIEMLLCPRIVILIDESQCWNEELIVSQIHLSSIRLLTYFSQACIQEGSKASLLWGYKFYNSIKYQKSAVYQQCQFFDHTIEEFEKFEEKLYSKQIVDLVKEKDKPKNCGEQLKTALTELLSDFQWDRPELFSPAKTKFASLLQGVNVVNMVFLFTACPKLSEENEKNLYFGNDYFNASNFMNLLFPDMLYEKFVQQSKISLYWVDTSCAAIQFVRPSISSDHCVIKAGLETINGNVISLQRLSQWWTSSASHSNPQDRDVISVSCLLKDLFSPTGDDGDSIVLKDCQLQWLDKFNYLPISIKHHVILKNVSCSIQTLVVHEKIKLNLMSPRHICYEDGPFLGILSPNDTREGKETQNAFKEVMKSREALLVTFTVSKSLTKHCCGIIIPATPLVISIIKIKDESFSFLREQATLDTSGTDKDGVVMDTRKPVESYVNAIDDWFYYNPILGFPYNVQNFAREIENDVIKENEQREENSQKLIAFMKEFRSKKSNEEKTKKKLNFRKGSRMKGLSWARWKLLEYQQKISDTQSVDKENINTVAPTIQPKNRTGEADLVNDLPGFECQKDLEQFVDSEISTMKSKKTLVPADATRLIKTINNYFTTHTGTNVTQSIAQLLDEFAFSTVGDIWEKFRENAKRDRLIIEYLLQVQLRLEWMTYLDKEEDRKEYIDSIVSFLRCISFEENTFFLRNHLTTFILPCYSTSLTTSIRMIYDEMMLELPDELREPMDEEVGDQRKDTNDECVEEENNKQVALPSSISYQSSDNSSIGSVQSDRKALRRHSSVVNDNTSSRRTIFMQVKTKSRKNRKTKEPGESFYKPSVPTTPKFRRRHSEITLRKRVPDTPESKQVNDVIWKKQERDRRHSNIDKIMAPIKESPVKEFSSPIKIRSLFGRSNSFSVRSSPRRFYAVNKKTEEILKENKKFKRHATFSGNLNDKIVTSPLRSASQTSTEMKLRRRSVLFSNFSDVSPYKALLKNSIGSNVKNENQDISVDGEVGAGHEDSEEKSFETTGGRRGIRRNIFEQKYSPDASLTTSISYESCSSSLKRSLSPIRSEAKKRKRSRKDDSQSAIKNDNEKHDDLPSFQLFNDEQDLSETSKRLHQTQLGNDVPIPSENSDFLSETTQDWLHQIEEDQRLATPKPIFDDVFEKSSAKPSIAVKCSPTILKTRNMRITISPCLSASSVDVLEKSPLLSPGDAKRGFNNLRRNIKLDYV